MHVGTAVLANYGNIGKSLYNVKVGHVIIKECAYNVNSHVLHEYHRSTIGMTHTYVHVCCQCQMHSLDQFMQLPWDHYECRVHTGHVMSVTIYMNTQHTHTQQTTSTNINHTKDDLNTLTCK